MDLTNDRIIEFVAMSSGERTEGVPEGPAMLGPYVVWRCWTHDGTDYHAHYVIADEATDQLLLKRDFRPFASWLMRAFNAADVRGRSLDWFRSGIAAVLVLTLLWLVVWAVTGRLAAHVDYRWLLGALAMISFGYLIGGASGAGPRTGGLRAPMRDARP